MKQFSRKTATQLKNYVYALVDPQTEEIFYVGKGSGTQRPFEHLDLKSDQTKNRKERKIKELRALSVEPRIDILRYGLDDQTAREVEAAIIDAIGLHRLANINSGSQSSDRGRLTARQVQAKLGGKPMDINEIQQPVILFYRRDSFPENRLYDETRQFWTLSRKRIEDKNSNNELKYQYAFAMKGNFVLEVYRILAWFPAGTTVSSRPYPRDDNKRRWEFVGSIAEENIGNKYRNRSLLRNGAPLHATQIGFRYLD